MRLDKFLKVSRLIRRRTVAKNAADGGRILVNGTPAKPGYNLEVGDQITIQLGTNPYTVEVVSLKEHVSKEEAEDLYKVVTS